MTGYRSIISTLLETPDPQNLATAPSASPPTTNANESGTMADPAPAKEKPMAIDTNSDDYKAGVAASTDATKTAERERFTTVMNSEHYQGREKLAANLLGTDMTAEAIIGALADAPKAEPKAAANDTEEAADREAMRQQLQANNPDLGTDTGDKEAAAAQAKAENYGWGKAYARATKPYGRKAAK